MNEAVFPNKSNSVATSNLAKELANPTTPGPLYNSPAGKASRGEYSLADTEAGKLSSKPLLRNSPAAQASRGGGSSIEHEGRWWNGSLSIAHGSNKPGVGRDMGSRKIPMYSPGGTLIQNPQPIYDEIGFNDEIKKRAVDWTDNDLLTDFKKLLLEFAKTSYSKKMVLGIYDHFKQNTGSDYSSWQLTNQVKGHPSLGRFAIDIANAFQNTINSGKNYLEDKSFSIQQHLIGQPRFNEFLDNFNGLRISVNDTWSYDVSVISYSEIDGNWSAQIKLTLYDHFGLDSMDITDHNYAEEYPGFYSWYILQHARGYKPFVTIMNIPEFKITGTLKN